MIAALVLASTFDTQHAFDYTQALNRRWDLTLHTRVRTQPYHGLGLYQVRVGPIASWRATSRLSLLGGYYFARQQRRADDDFIGGHRLFGGADFTVVRNRHLAADLRGIAERFLSDAAPDFSRYRFRSRLSGRTRVAPTASYEVFLDRRGWRGDRYTGGVRWNVRSGIQVEVGYLYEHRRPDVGPHRHILTTSLQFRRANRR